MCILYFGKFSCWETVGGINPSLHRYSFWCINNSQLLKTLWEKEKLLVTSNFSFSHSVFYSIRYICNCIPICHVFDIKSFFAAELEEPKIGMLGKGLIICSYKFSLSYLLQLLFTIPSIFFRGRCQYANKFHDPIRVWRDSGSLSDRFHVYTCWFYDKEETRNIDAAARCWQQGVHLIGVEQQRGSEILPGCWFWEMGA